MSEQSLRQLPLRILPASMLLARSGALGGRASIHLIERHARVYRHTWLVLASGFFEPLFYLLSIRVGFGELIGDVEYAGRTIPYADFVAPALFAASAMNGSILLKITCCSPLASLNIFSSIAPLRTKDAAMSQ